MGTTLKAVQVLKTPFHTLQVIWKRRYSLLIFLTLLLKLICVNLNNIYPPPTVARAKVTYDPLSLFDPSSSTFTVLDRSNVSFLIEPEQRKVCPPNSSLLLLALSALKNVERRKELRSDFANNPDVGVVFLLAETEDEEKQAQIEEEASENGDILQVDHLLEIFLIGKHSFD